MSNYELKCSNLLYDSIKYVMNTNIDDAKKEILKNVINSNLNEYIDNFSPYKSRLELNIPLLRENIKHHLYSLLPQFYCINKNKIYGLIEKTGSTHEDINELVLKITDILSNKILGKEIVPNISIISSVIFNKYIFLLNIYFIK